MTIPLHLQEISAIAKSFLDNLPPEARTTFDLELITDQEHYVIPVQYVSKEIETLRKPAEIILSKRTKKIRLDKTLSFDSYHADFIIESHIPLRIQLTPGSKLSKVCLDFQGDFDTKEHKYRSIGYNADTHNNYQVKLFNTYDLAPCLDECERISRLTSGK